MGEQGDQSLKVLGRSLSDFGVFKDVKIKMGGKPFLLSRLDRLLAKTDGTVNSGAFM